MGGAFALDPIYQGDLSREGSQLAPDTYAGNAVLTLINEQLPNFDGVVCIASVSCDHCTEAAHKLGILQARTPDRDVAVILFTNDSLYLTEFPMRSKAENLTYFLAPSQQSCMDITGGGFPVVFYMRDGVPLH